MLPLTGYADRLSVRPGETIRFHLANATGAEVEAELVRVVCADSNPAGPGVILEPVASSPTACATATRERSLQGSHARIENPGRCFGTGGFSVTCRVWPTTVAGTRRTILSRTDGAAAGGFVLALDEHGRLCASFGDGASMRDVATVPRPLAEREWHGVWLVVDAEAGEARIGWAGISPRLGEMQGPHRVHGTLPCGAAQPVTAPLLVAATDHALPTRHFNGKIEDPAVYARPLTSVETETYAGGGHVERESARWDFSRCVESSRVEDSGPHGLHGSLVNIPTRGVTGSRWTGREMCWRHAPREYAAIHFHDDDIDDCGWPAAFEWTVPDATRSSTYALLLSAGDARENIPFFVVPPKGTRTAPVAVLVSTFTYTVYANHSRPEWSQDPQWKADWKAQAAAWGALSPQRGRSRRIRILDLQLSFRRKRDFHRLLAPSDADDADRLHHLSVLRNSRLGNAALPCRHPPHGLARGERVRLRYRHRSGAARRRRRPAELLPRGHDGHSPRVPHSRDA